MMMSMPISHEYANINLSFMIIAKLTIMTKFKILFGKDSCNGCHVFIVIIMIVSNSIVIFSASIIIIAELILDSRTYSPSRTYSR